MTHQNAAPITQGASLNLVVALTAMFALLLALVALWRSRAALAAAKLARREVYGLQFMAGLAEASETVEAETAEAEPDNTIKPETYTGPVLTPGLFFRVQLLPPGTLGQPRMNCWRTDGKAHVEVSIDTSGTYSHLGSSNFDAWTFKLYDEAETLLTETYLPIEPSGPSEGRIVSEIRALLNAKTQQEQPPTQTAP